MTNAEGALEDWCRRAGEGNAAIARGVTPEFRGRHTVIGFLASGSAKVWVTSEEQAKPGFRLGILPRSLSMNET